LGVPDALKRFRRETDIKEKIMKRRLLALSLIVAALFLLSGCLSTPEKTAKDKTGNKVTVDGKNGKVKIKYKKGWSSTESGDNVKLPKGFPKDIPIYKGAKVKTARTLKNYRGTSKLVIFEVKSSLQKVSDFYQKELSDAGYHISGTFSSDKLTSFSAEKDNAKVGIRIFRKNDIISAYINYTKK